MRRPQEKKDAAKGGAAASCFAALGLILEALAAAFGGKTGQRYLGRHDKELEEQRGAGYSAGA